jgi:ribosomal protein S18 acetylase RimI-like enzyme
MPKVSIRPGTPEDLGAVQAVNLAAFEAIDESFAEILGPQIYPLVYPDWQTSQQRDVEQLVAKPNTEMVVAELNSRVVGFAIVQLNRDRRVGELCIIGVHPDFRRQGIGAMLNEAALRIMRDAGMTLAELGTGGDPAHAAARRSYERAGYRALPLVRYYRAL